jgi:hypothetical protein
VGSRGADAAISQAACPIEEHGGHEEIAEPAANGAQPIGVGGDAARPSGGAGENAVDSRTARVRPRSVVPLDAVLEDSGVVAAAANVRPLEVRFETRQEA